MFATWLCLKLCDEFKLTLTLEFADDGVEESVLVRHMTSSHGHGSDHSSDRLCVMRLQRNNRPQTGFLSVDKKTTVPL